MIESLLPDRVAHAEAFADVDESLMWPAEAAAVAGAVQRRRREFGTVRHCARRALAALGHPPGPILNGPKREPLWPPGVVGSMTHCRGYRAAVVADAARVPTLGLDAEPHAPLPDGVLESIARPEERPRLAALRTARPEVHTDRLLFCAKEATYKAWYPLARRWLDFEDASVSFDPGGGFRAAPLVRGPWIGGAPLDGFAGRWRVEAGLVVAVIWALTGPGRGAVTTC